MQIRVIHLIPLLAAGAVAATIVAAPIAAAAPTPMQQTCTAVGQGTECQSPGNVQIDDSPPAVGFDPYGDYGLALGGFGYGYGGGGFHGGGFHGGGGGHR